MGKKDKDEKDDEERHAHRKVLLAIAFVLTVPLVREGWHRYQLWKKRVTPLPGPKVAPEVEE